MHFVYDNLSLVVGFSTLINDNDILPMLRITSHFVYQANNL